MNAGHVIKNCFSGFYALLRDPAGVMCLLVLGLVSFLALKGKIGDMAFSACCTMIPAVVVLMKHRAFRGSDIDEPAPSPPEPMVIPAPPAVVAPDVAATPIAPSTATVTIPLANLPVRGIL